MDCSLLDRLSELGGLDRDTICGSDIYLFAFSPGALSRLSLLCFAKQLLRKKKRMFRAAIIPVMQIDAVQRQVRFVLLRSTENGGAAGGKSTPEPPYPSSHVHEGSCLRGVNPGVFESPVARGMHADAPVGKLLPSTSFTRV